MLLVIYLSITESYDWPVIETQDFIAFSGIINKEAWRVDYWINYRLKPSETKQIDDPRAMHRFSPLLCFANSLATRQYSKASRDWLRRSADERTKAAYEETKYFPINRIELCTERIVNGG